MVKQQNGSIGCTSVQAPQVRALSQAIAMLLVAGGVVANAGAQQAFSPAWFANKGVQQQNAVQSGRLPNGMPSNLVRGARRVTLQPGWQARLDPDRIASVAQVASDRIDAWRQGWLVVDDQPLAEVVQEINRYRPGRIVITGTALQARRVQARIPLRDLDAFIDLVRNAYGARVVTMPGGVVLLS